MLSRDDKTKIWWYDFRFEKRRYRGSTWTQNKSQAEKFLKKHKENLHAQSNGEIDTTKKVGDAAMEFMREYDAINTSRANRNYKIQRAHYSKVFAYLLENIGDVMLIKVQQKILTRMAHDMLESGKSAATVNNYFSVINKLFSKCKEQWEWLSSAPKVRLFPVDNAIIRYITRDEADRLITALPASLGKMAEFTLQTGLRWGNVARLEWSQVHLERKCLVIDGFHMKNGKSLFVPLTPKAIEIIKGQVGTHQTNVFVTHYGKPFASKISFAVWPKALKKAEITNFRWHDLRHTWASWHVQKGTALNVLMELGGWSSYEMVLRYAHLSKAHLSEVVK